MSKIEELASKLNLTMSDVSNQLDSVIWYYQTITIMTYLFFTAFIVFSIYFCKSIYKDFLKKESDYDFDIKEGFAVGSAIVALAFFITMISSLANTFLLFSDPQSWLLVKIISASSH